jgi:hypothetical protein
MDGWEKDWNEKLHGGHGVYFASSAGLACMA